MQRQQEEGATRFNVSAYTDVREMVDCEKPEVCDVVVPAELHHVVSCYLSRCGIHHNVETPLAPTLGLMDLMIEAACKHGAKLQTSENFPFVPVEQFVCKLICENVIGPVHKCYRLFSTTGYHGLAAIRCRLDATPVAVSSVSHTMPVVPYVDRAKRNFDTESLEFYTVDFDNGGIGIAMVGNKNGGLGSEPIGRLRDLWGARHYCDQRQSGALRVGKRLTCARPEISPSVRVRRGLTNFSVNMLNQTSLSGFLSNYRTNWVGQLNGRIRIWRVGLQERNISLATMLDGIGRAVREDIDPLWTGEMGRADQEMVLAAGRSIQMNRQPIALPLPPDPSEEEAFDQNF